MKPAPAQQTTATPGPWTVNPKWNKTRDCAQIDSDGPTCIAGAFYLGGTDTARANARLMAAAPDMKEALELIRQDGCESFTTGLGSCFRDGRTPNAEYGADRCCPSCIADAALANAGAA